MADEFVGKAAFAKVDEAQAPEAFEKYDVAAFPTTVIFKDGKEAGRVVGADADEIRQSLQRTL